jgi:hypothetical protein
MFRNDLSSLDPISALDCDDIIPIPRAKREIWPCIRHRSSRTSTVIIKYLHADRVRQKPPIYYLLYGTCGTLGRPAAAGIASAIGPWAGSLIGAMQLGQFPSRSGRHIHVNVNVHCGLKGLASRGDVRPKRSHITRTTRSLKSRNQNDVKLKMNIIFPPLT